MINNTWKLFRNSWHLLIPLLIAIYLRGNGITKSAFWYDEAFTIYLTRQPLPEMVRLMASDFHPPLREIIQWFIRTLLGETEFSYRLIPFLSSLAIILIAYAVIKNMQLTKFDTFLVLILITTSTYQIWMAQDARVYSFFSFIYLLAIIFILKGQWIGTFACCGLLLYLNNAGVFYSFSLALTYFLLNHKKWRYGILGSLLSLLAFAPWFMVFLEAVTANYFSPPELSVSRVVFQTAAIFIAQSVTSLWVRMISLFFFCFLGLLFFLSSIKLLRRLFSEICFSKLLPPWFTTQNPSEKSMIAIFLLSFLPLIFILVASITYRNVFLYRSLSAIAVP